MPLSALPERLQTLAGWKGTDNDKWWARWWLWISLRTACGPRAKERWARWREYPITLFLIAHGPIRVETSDGSQAEAWEGEGEHPRTLLAWATRFEKDVDGAATRFYVSEVQYWAKWCIILQWPLFLKLQRYDKSSDVPSPNQPRPGDTTDGKLWNFYIGCHRDGDKVYWPLSVFLGRNHK